jgi:hypothetical protein
VEDLIEKDDKEKQQEKALHTQQEEIDRLKQQIQLLIKSTSKK